MNHKRHKRLLKLLDEHGQASTEELMQWLPASAATVRRDLAWLAARQQLRRQRGGAQRLQPDPHTALRGQAFGQTLGERVAQKRAIAHHAARHAASLCRDGDALIINGGSTTFMMAEFLSALQLRILTNSLPLAAQLLSHSRHEVLLPGGSVYREQHLIVSPFEDDVSRHFYARCMFTGAHGLSALGLTEVDPLLVQAERRLIGQAEQLVVLADSSKFSRRSGLVVCGLDRVHCLITDTDAPDQCVQWLERQGVRVVTVAPEPMDDNALAFGLGAAPALNAKPGLSAPSRAPMFSAVQ